MQKIRYIIFLLLTLSIIQVSGQTKFDKEFSLGINAGLTGSKIDFLLSFKQNYLWGYDGGLTFRYISEKHFGLQIETNFSQSGWQEKSDSSRFSRRLNYVEIPFLSHIYFGNKFRFFVNLGPKIAYLLSDNKDTDMAELSEAQHAKDINRRFDYGLCGGGGFEWRTTKLRFLLEGRYYFGLGDIFPNSRNDDFMRSAHRDFSLNLVVLRRLNK